MGTKSSIDRKRSKYGEKFSLRFHKPERVYNLSCNDCHPMLLAKFTEVDGGLAIHCWETLEKLYQENKQLKTDKENAYKAGYLTALQDIHERENNERMER